MLSKKRKNRKSAAEEFTEKQLPHTRRQQFGDCIKVRFSLLVRCGLLLLIFLAPCLVLGVIKDLAIGGIIAETSGATAETELAQSVNGINLVVSAINAVCLIIASLGFAGVARVLRQLIWGEGVFLRSDFIAGIKSNGRAYALLFALAGLAGFVNTLVSTLQFPVEFVKYVPYAICAVVFLPVGMFVLSQTVVYSNGAGTSIKNGCILYIKAAPSALAFVIALLLPVAAGFIPLLMLKYLLFIALVVLALPLYLLAWLLLSFHLFDKYINKELFPELCKRGLSDIAD